MNPYQILAPGLCHVSGQHLSEAPNSPTFAAIHEETQADARAILRERRLIEQQVSDAIRGEWRPGNQFNSQGGW